MTSWVNAVVTLRIPISNVHPEDSDEEKMEAVSGVMDDVVNILELNSDFSDDFVGLASWEIATDEPDIIPSFTGCMMGSDPDEPSHMIYDSRDTPRATAISRTASEYGISFAEARCETAYCRWFTRQEVWDYGAGGRWWDVQHVRVNENEDMPREPPADWEPNPERDSTFTFCKRGTSYSVAVWVVSTGEE